MSNSLDTIQQGDCIQGMNALPSGSVDLVFADPPFNIGYEYDEYQDSKEKTQYLNWSRSWISSVYQVLKPHGTFWLAIGDEYAAELKVAAQNIGFHTRSWVIWYYTFGVNCSKKFSRSHAHLFHFVKDPNHFTFLSDKLENRLPSARQLVYADNRANPKGRLADDTWILRPQDLQDCFTLDEDTWYFPRVAGTFKERAGFHGCQMPEQLLGRIIRLCSNEGDVVMDPFAGSATTLVVAKKMGRQFLGFELSKEYVKRGNERLANVYAGDPLEGSPEPLVSAPKTLEDPEKKGTKGAKKSIGVPTLSEAQVADKVKDELALGLLKAFEKSSDGYSLDRVIADPELNAALAAECRRLHLFGDVRTWNHTLLRLRKAGKLVNVETSKRTEAPWEEFDSFLFASEIALRQMLDQGHASLDEILCEPALATQFDELASRLAPGFTPLQYRLGALKLRKEAKRARTRAVALAPVHLERERPLPVQNSSWKKLPKGSGVYLVTGNGGQQMLYAGESRNLRERLTTQFGTPALLKEWKVWSEDLSVLTFSTEDDWQLLLAYQSTLVTKHKPLLNFQELAAV